MGSTTDFVGRIEIDPPLNDSEVEYLTAFADSRRCIREGGPYDVPGNPRAESSAEFADDRYNRCAEGQPSLWCSWSVCWDGCCLAWSGAEKSYAMVEWLRYLIAHFLRPGARAMDDPRFDGFTFDHSLDGMVVGCRRDNKELFSVVVHRNRVTERILVPADPRFVEYPPLPYELANDSRQPRRLRRRDRTVVSLPSRRLIMMV